MRREYTRAATAVLLLLALTHAFFAMDIAVRVWQSRMHFENPGEAMLLVWLELARATALIVAGVAVARVARGGEPYRPMMALALAALAVWYGASFTFPGVAGYAQGVFATWLRGAGVPDGVLATVFVDGGWALWLAVAATLRAAAHLVAVTGHTPDAIRRDDTGRPGLLRGSAVAGADVGSAFRNAAAAAIENGWLAPRVVWPAALGLITLHVLSPPSLRGALTFVLIVAAAVAFTLLRSALRGSGGRERGVLRWLAVAGAVAAVGFVAGGGFALLSPAGMMMPTFFITAVTPVAVAACLARAGWA